MRTIRKIAVAGAARAPWLGIDDVAWPEYASFVQPGRA